MKKNVPALRLVTAADTAPALPGMPAELLATLGDVAATAREELLALSVAAGMAVMQAMFEQEITAVVGPKGRHDGERVAVCHGTERGSVVLGGRRVPVSRPRARTVAGTEVPLASYDLFAAEDLLSQVVMAKMLAGVATRRHARTLESVGATVAGQAKSMSRSAVSRRFVRDTETARGELLEAPLADLDVKVVMIDGVHMADHCMVSGSAPTARTPTAVSRPPAIWPRPCNASTPARPPRYAKAWSRCSPSPAWVSPLPWPRR